MSPSPTIQALKLQFYDLTVALRSDSPAYLDLFTRFYRRFQVEQPPAGSRPVQMAVFTRAANPWGRPVLVIDNQVWPLPDTAWQEAMVYGYILDGILSRVRSHFLIHAGVVSCRGQGVILAADSFHGKTTLVLALVRQGFQFLSDELAALSRADGRVHPFPRALRVRPGSLERAGFSPFAAPLWQDKLFMDVETVQPDSMGSAAPIRRVIILQDPAASSAETADSERELEVRLARLDDDLLTAIDDLVDVSRVRPSFAGQTPLLRVWTSNPTPVAARIEALCREQQTLLLGLGKRVENRPSFDQPPRLEPLSKGQTIIELLRRFEGGHKSALLHQTFGGSSIQLFSELAALIEPARCHRLFVGSLPQTVKLVQDLVTA